MLKTNRQSPVNPKIDEESRALFHDIVRVNEEVWFQMGLEFGAAIVSGELEKKATKHLRRAVREIALATDIYLNYANREQLLTQTPVIATGERGLPPESDQWSLSPPRTEQ